MIGQMNLNTYEIKNIYKYLILYDKLDWLDYILFQSNNKLELDEIELDTLIAVSPNINRYLNDLGINVSPSLLLNYDIILKYIDYNDNICLLL